MTVWNNIPIKRKLTGVILLTSMVSLLLACGAFILYEWTEFRTRMVDELSVQAAMIGANSTAALTFKDQGSAEDTLRALAFGRSVRAAVIFTPSREIFASYKSAKIPAEAELPFEEQGQRFEGDLLLLWRPITLTGQTVGTIALSAGLDAMTKRLWTYVGIAALILLFAMGAALLFASALQVLSPARFSAWRRRQGESTQKRISRSGRSTPARMKWDCWSGSSTTCSINLRTGMKLCDRPTMILKNECGAEPGS